MKALVFTKPGGLDVLKIQEVAKPVPKDNQVLIRVKAGALNIADCQPFESLSDKVSLQNRALCALCGFAGNPLGTEISGIVETVGNNVAHVKPGDKVFGKSAGFFPKGGFAEYALMDSERVAVMPKHFSFEQAACVSVSFETALGALRKGRVKAGDEVMIYGASGGVGLFAVQIACAMGALVTGVCSTRNIELARSAGCKKTIDYKQEDFAACDDRFDAIIGVNGCNPMKTYKRLLKASGIFVGVGNATQAFHALGRSLTDKQFTYLAGVANLQEGYLDYARELAEAGKLSPHIDKVYSVHEAKEAIRYMLAEHAQGKVVLRMDF